jgi:hypothetical protein
VEDTSAGTLGVTIGDMTQIAPAGNLGPGLGDVICYIKNVRLIWIGNVDEGASLSFLGADDTLVLATAQSLRKRVSQLPDPTAVDPSTGLTRDAMQSLLDLDPFVTNEPFDEDPRFTDVDLHL